MTVLDEMQAARLKHPRHFERLARSRIRAGARRSAARRWQFFIPAIVAFDPSTRVASQIRILDRAFRFKSATAVERNLGRRALAQELAGLPGAKPPDSPAWYLVVTSEGDSWEEAWRLLEPAFDTLRGLAEFVFGYGQATLSFPPEPRARVKVPHPRFLLVRTPEGGLDSAQFLIEESRPKDIFTIKAATFNVLRRLALRFARQPAAGSTLSLLTHVLRLYAQAMDARFSYACFLGLWQVLETVSLAQFGRTEEVCKGVAWHAAALTLPGSGFAQILKDFARKRNEIVHQGIHRIDQEDVNTIKRISEIALRWLLLESKRMRTTRHLEVFYQLRTAGDASVEAHSEVARYIARQRQHP